MFFNDNKLKNDELKFNCRFTKTGSLKDATECAPNNGYYFLPLYDKGEYVLKVN